MCIAFASKFTKQFRHTYSPNICVYSVLYADVANGSLLPSSGFIPSEDIRRSDADTFLVFLSGNGVVFSEPADDDWYRATKYLYNVTAPEFNATWPVYGFEDAASPLACVQRHQFCHTSLPESDRCGPFASLLDTMEGAESMATSDKTMAQLTWVSEQIGHNAGVTDPILLLGPQSLASQRGLSGGFQGPLKANQWQLDVINWWATFLAAVQLAFVNGVIGPTDTRLHKYMHTELLPALDNTIFQNICRNQVCIVFRTALFIF